jgi:hypothetical protein
MKKIFLILTLIAGLISCQNFDIKHPIPRIGPLR